MVEPMKTQQKNSYAGKYRIIKALGEGGFGVVKQAELEGTDEKYALKFIKPHILEKSDIKNEIAIMAKLNHPNIVKFVECFEKLKYFKPDGRTLERFTVVTELAEKGCLVEYLQISQFAFKRGFPESFARRYFHQLISALDHCHSLGIAHRDLKPDNLLLDDDYNLKVADFGWATMINKYQNDLLKTNVGTPAYQAPEIIQGEEYDGKASDIFTAGIILFQMIFGVAPFQRANRSDFWYRWIWSGEYEKFWELHQPKQGDKFTIKAEFKELINALLAKSPADRPTMEEIKSCAWYNGKVADAKDLKQEFDQYQSYIGKINEKEKEKRREEKQQRQNEIHLRNLKLTQGVFMGVYSMRDLELASDLEKTIKELNLKCNLEAVRELSVYTNACKKPATSMLSLANEQVLFRKLILVLNSYFSESIVSDKKYKMKAECIDPDTLEITLSVQVEIFKVDDVSNCIEFTKKSGDYLKFLDVILNKIKPELGNLIETSDKQDNTDDKKE